MKIKDVLNEEENLIDNQIVRLSSEASTLLKHSMMRTKNQGWKYGNKNLRGKLVGNSYICPTSKIQQRSI